MDDGYVLHTEPDWLSYHTTHHPGQSVAFMRGPSGSLARFTGGEVLIFVSRDVNPHEIAGIATFIRNNIGTLGDAWDQFGKALGAGTRQDFYRLAPIQNPTANSPAAVLEAENFRPVSPPIRLTDLGLEDKQGATRGWYLSAEETSRLIDQLGHLRPALQDGGFEEGNPILRRHLNLERNQNLIALAKRHWANVDPNLCCEVCGFSFLRRYGALGAGFIEAHHRLPLHELRGGITRTTIVDLAPVCSNCHRMLHVDDGRSLDTLRSLLQGDTE